MRRDVAGSHGRPALPWRFARLVCLMASSATPAHAQLSARPDAERLVAVVQRAAPRALESHGAPGAAVGMVLEGEFVWSGAFGLADVERGAPMTPETVFEIASVTKPIVAWAVLRLAEEGRIDLDAPIESYLTRWRLPDSEYDRGGVTARTILAHAAGLSSGGDPGVEPGETPPTLEEAASGAVLEGGAIRLVAPPGQRYRYSSKGYLLLEMAIEEVTGERFADFVRRTLLDPLGMTNSAFEWTRELSSRGATGYDWYGRPLPRYEHATRAPGGLRATVGDVSRFVAAHVESAAGPPGRGIISPRSVQEILTPYPYTDASALVGLGYNLSMGGGTLVARKSGDHRGWKSIAFLVPEMRAGLVVLANSDRAAAGVFADIACPWSEALPGNPLREVCGQMRAFRTVQLGLAAVLFFVFAFGATRLGRALVRGTRHWAVPGTPARAFTTLCLCLALTAWWAFWYTDVPARLLGYPPTFVTVRFDPWPTAFIWVSWAFTLVVGVGIVTTLTRGSARGTGGSSGPREPQPATGPPR